MKLSGKTALNLSFMILFFLCICAVQSTLWYQIVGPIPPPLLWPLILFYILITRESFSAIMLCYFFTFIASRFSSAPLGVLFPVIGLISASVLVFRSRIFWRGSSYFFLVSFAGIFLYHFFSFIVSFILESNSAGFLALDRLTQIVLTFGFFYPMYKAMKWIDRTFQYQDGFGTGELI